MLGSCCRRLRFLLPNSRNVVDSVTILRFSRREAIFMRSYSSESLLVAENNKPIDKGRSFTVSYLINSCGLSPELALCVSKRVQFDTQDGPDSVLNLLKDHGLTDAHISILVKKRPDMLLGNARKIILPKLEFFGSVGISGSKLAQLICFNPDVILNKSLERSIIPCYEIIKSLLLLDNFKVDRFFMGLWRASAPKILSNIPPNISVLRVLRVQEASISNWLAQRPFVMSLETEKFKETVNKVISMGLCPSSSSNLFMTALFVISGVDAPEWAQKMVLYRKWGWTEDDLFLVAFRKDPRFMRLSEMKFSSKMDFLVNRMGWQPADVAVYPTALTCSLEKRIIPRCSVIRILHLKGLIVQGHFSLSSILNTGQQYFLDRFVIKYQEQIPELLSIFDGKLGLAELGLEFEQRGGGKQL